MKYSIILVRYGEIALKSSYVRKKFETILIKNISKALKQNKIEYKIEKEYGRIYVYTDKISNSIDILKKIFGIISISPAVKIKADMGLISKKAVSFVKEKIKSEKSFAIRSNRSGNHDFTSRDVAVKIGQDIVDELGLKVDLTNPDFELFIDTREKYSYIFDKKINGIGGLPVGSQNKLLCIVKEKTSLLASFYLLKRGCSVFYFVDENFDKKVIEKFLDKWFIKKNIKYFNFEKSFYKNLDKMIVNKKCKAVIFDIFKK